MTTKRKNSSKKGNKSRRQREVEDEDTKALDLTDEGDEEVEEVEEVEEDEIEDDADEDAEPEKGPYPANSRVKITFIANQIGFDGVHRVRRGRKIIRTVDTDANGNLVKGGKNGKAKWWSTPEEWAEQLRQEAEAEEAETKKRKQVRGGATTFQEL